MNNKYFHTAFTAVLIGAAVLFTINASATSNNTYHLKGDALIGSKIPTIEAISPVSFTKTYEQLSESELNQVRSKYQNLDVNDTPPFPSLGLRTIYKPIIKANQNLNVTGSLHLTATVSANGFVESVRVVKSPNVKLSAHAEKILRNIQFDPARCNGVACEMTFPIEMTFK